VAEELGIPVDRVEVINSDTAVKPWDVGAHASRTTFIAGNAALLAARELKEKLLAMAARVMDERAGDLELRDGHVRARSHPERTMAYERVVRAGHFRSGGRTLVAEAFYDPPNEMLSKDLRGNVSAAYGFAAQAVLVEVDEATGKVDVLKIASAHDVGRALNPPAAEGQIHGGIHMGLGYALCEELVIREGRVLNAQFMEYALVPAGDMPEIAIRLIETVDEAG
jgi:CO/xanthine dehydrogenase Mo-binding subunit